MALPYAATQGSGEAQRKRKKPAERQQLKAWESRDTTPCVKSLRSSYTGMYCAYTGLNPRTYPEGEAKRKRKKPAGSNRT